MSYQGEAPNFDKIIQADRQRRKNEELANSIFGKSRFNDASKKKDTRRQSGSPSLASRIGISKRSSSASSTNPVRNPPSRPSSAAAQHARQNRLATEIGNQQMSNIVTAKSTGPGLSIKGAAAPFVVEARNFAPGTTDADIASAFQQSCVDSNGNNALVSCKILATKPTVTAELVFNDRAVANTIISQYDKKNADNHTLALRLVRSGPGSMSRHHTQTSKSQPTVTLTETEAPGGEDDIMEDVDTEEQVKATNDLYNQEREAAERDRRDRESRRDTNGHDSGRSRAQNDRKDEQRDRDRDSDRDRDRDRERDRDRTRGRDHERNAMDERSSYRRDETGNSRPTQYGSGIGGSARLSYRGSYAGGRGGYAGYNGYAGRGGYRAGYGGYR